jgi:hypothetical protein
MKRANWILGSFAAIALPLVAYLGAYLWLGESYHDGPIHVRSYKSYRVMQAFRPVASVETWITGNRTLVGVTVTPD